MKCDYCEIAKRKIKAEVVYEDKKCIAVIKDLAAFPGQICLFPKEHYTIIELVPDEIVNHLFKIANKLGTAVFEALGVHGTNIIVQNGTPAGQSVPHFCVEIIPRKENDGLNFEWKIKQPMEEEMDTAHLMLKEEGDMIIVGSSGSGETVYDGKREKIEGEENYLVKQLKRIP